MNHHPVYDLATGEMIQAKRSWGGPGSANPNQYVFWDQPWESFSSNSTKTITGSPFSTTWSGERIWSSMCSMSMNDGIGPDDVSFDTLPDGDGDGYAAEDDCDDTDGSIHPFAGDIYGDGVDSDCDGMDCEAAYVGEVYYAVCRKSASGEDLTTSWSGANTTCTDFGYDSLAKSVDATETSGLRDLVLDAGGWGDTWIGLSDPEDDGTWTWMDGTEAIHTDWGPGEPSSGEDNCVEIYSVNDWTWNDRPCSGTFPFACEIRPSEVDADGDGYAAEDDCDDTDGSIHPFAGDTLGDGIDSDCDGLDCEAIMSGDTYFAACPGGFSWSSGESHCTSGGHDGLASILSASENDTVEDLLGALDTRAWIGMNDLDSEGVWEWSSGREGSFESWYDGSGGGMVQPSGDGDCGYMYSPTDGGPYPGLWNDYPCGSTSEGSFSFATVCETRTPEVDDSGDMCADGTESCWLSCSAGDDHTCGVTGSGSVECWGRDDEGGASPPPGSFDSVSAGGYHSCGVNSAANVECWGRDTHGQASPPAGSFDSVSAGGSHTCGVTGSGSVECWGSDGSGQASPPSGSFDSVSAGDNHTCGVTSTGSVECWGSDSGGKSTPPPGSFVSVSATWYHTCGVTSTGSVECWGHDEWGDGKLTPPSESFESVSAGVYHTCGVTSEGNVECWGRAGLLGGDADLSGSFDSVSAGDYHSCGITSEGSIVSWGNDEWGMSSPPEL
jgi:hypothetical protein